MDEERVRDVLHNMRLFLLAHYCKWDLVRPSGGMSTRQVRMTDKSAYALYGACCELLREEEIAQDEIDKAAALGVGTAHLAM